MVRFTLLSFNDAQRSVIRVGHCKTAKTVGVLHDNKRFLSIHKTSLSVFYYIPRSMRHIRLMLTSADWLPTSVRASKFVDIFVVKGYHPATRSIGYSVDSNEYIVTLQISAAASSIHPIVCGGEIMGKNDTMCAALLWLQTKNDEFAPMYGVPRLVWCEEHGGVKKSKRFYSLDEKFRRQACANLGVAIRCMERFTRCNFHTDMQTNFLHAS